MKFIKKRKEKAFFLNNFTVSVLITIMYRKLENMNLKEMKN